MLFRSKDMMPVTENTVYFLPNNDAEQAQIHVLRRIPAAAEKETLVIGELSIHLPSLSVTLSGHKLNLTRREVELLYTLAASPGRVFTRDNLLTIVWGYEFAGNYRAVDSHIKRLRAKLDAYPHDTFTIATVWGAGYKFERNLP